MSAPGPAPPRNNGRLVDFGSEVLRRSEDGGAGVSQRPDRESHSVEWDRVERIDNRVVCVVSGDGPAWQTADERPVAFGDTVCVGLTVCRVTR